MKGLNTDAHHAAKRRTNRHTGHKDTGWHLASERYDDQQGSDGSCNSKRRDIMPSLCRITQPVVVLALLALSKQNLHALRHVNSQKHVGVAYDTRDDGQDDSLSNRVRSKVLFAKDLHLEIPFDDKGAVKTAENTNDEVEDDLEKVPRTIVRNVEHNQLTSTEGVHGL